MEIRKLLKIRKTILTMLFVVSSYFATQAQTLGLTRRYGSTGAEVGTVAHVDAASNSYTAGSFNNIVSFGSTTLTASGANNGFLIKNSSGGVVQYVKGFIGTGSATITDIKSNSNLEIYVSGYFTGNIDFDPSVGTSIIGSNLGTSDIFVAKLNAGGGLIWVRTAGGSGDDYAHSLALDTNGDIIIGGSVDDNNGSAIDFDPSAGQSLISTLSRDGVLWRLDAFNGTYVGVGKYGTTNSDEVRKVLVDASGNVYVAGYYSIQLASSGVLSILGTGNLDAFIIKYGPTYSFQWYRQFGGLQDQVVYDLDVDASGNVYSVGTYRGASGNTSDFDKLSTLGGLAGLSNTISDGFICKLNTSGTFQWVNSIKGDGIDYPKKVSLNSVGDLIVAGIFQGTCDFDPSTLTSSFTSKGGYDVFIAKYNSNGVFSNNIQTFGDVGDDFLNGFGLNSSTTYYVSGSFNNIINVGSSASPLNLTSSGLSDAFFLSYAVCTMPPTPSINTGASTLSFCNNSSVLLQVNSLPVSTTVRWYANSTITSTLQSNTSYSFNTPVLTASTNFYVSASNTCGESARNIAIVTKTPPPNVTVSGSPTTICLGQSATLTGHNANTYSWAGGPNTSTYVVSPTVTTTYSVTGTASVGCTDIGTFTLVVKSLPGISAISTRNNYCSDNATINVSATGANSYYWHPPINSFSALYNVNPQVTTVYTVTGTSVGGCTKDFVLTVTIKALPVVTVTASKVAFCTNELVTVSFSGASLYNVGSGFTATNTTSRLYSVAGTFLINYSAQGSNGCTITGAPFSVSVVSPPVITGTITPSASTCVGITSTITRFGGTISWPSNAGLTVLNPNTATISPTVTTTSFVVTATGIPGCKSTSNVSISRLLNITPSIAISATQTNICSGTGVTFSGVASNTNGGNLSYIWKKNNATIATSPIYSATNLIGNDQLTLTVVVTNPTCLTTNTVSSNVITMTSAAVNPSVSISTSNTTVCEGQATDFNANIINGGSNPFVTWKVGNTLINNNSTLLSTSTLTNGVTVICIITSTGNCLSSTSATSSGISMSVNPATTLLTALPSSPSTTCGFITYSLTASGLNNTFTWSDGFTSSGNTSSIVASTSGDYSATVTGTCGSASSNIVSLSKLAAPQISGSLTSSSICGGNFILLAVPVSGDNLSYFWSNGETTADVYTSVAGIYTMTVLGTCGNAVSNSATITVENCNPTQVAFAKNSKSDISIYPNPSNGIIYIINGVGLKTLYDAIGSELNSFEGNEYDLSNLKNGIYFIKIQNKFLKVVKD